MTWKELLRKFPNWSSNDKKYHSNDRSIEEIIEKL
jgi:hypothetical protein